MNHKHWSEFYLQQPIISSTVLGKMAQHHTELLYLADGSRWVCKLFNPHTWLGETNYTRLQFSENLAAAVESTLNISFAARKWPATDEVVLTVNGQYALIIPYYEGNTAQSLTTEQAFLLGKKLAQLHRLNFFSTKAQPFPAIKIPVACKPEIQSLIAHCNLYGNYKSEEWVISHRDIHLKNIIWQNEYSPHFIDWESAGLIHPFIELIGLANNCAGLAVGFFSEYYFYAVLDGYRSYTGNLPESDDILWQLIFHSWLLWYNHCLSRNNEQEAQETLRIINFIVKKLQKMKSIYYSCSKISVCD